MTIRILLSDLMPGTQYAVKFRGTNGLGGASEWSQVQRFTTTNDLIHPGNVTNLTWSDTGDSLMATWDKVIVNEDSTAFNDFRSYHVQVTDGTTLVDYYPLDNRFEFSRSMNVATFGTYKNNLTIKVWAVDMTHNESRTATTAVASPAAPPTPSTPTVGTYLGLLLVTWDGKQANGTAMPSNTNYCEVHVSTISNFTPSASTYLDRVYSSGAASKVTLTGLAYGTLYYVRLVAVSFAGKSSGPSTQASGTPTRISGLDITPNGLGTGQINFTAYDIGGANAYYPATTTARDAIVGAKNGDIAYVTGSGYATYRYNGSAWVSAPEIGVIQGSKILAGTVTSNAVGTNLLITNKANIGNAVIDQANIATVNAASITTGQLSVGQKIIAGPVADTHAEMSDTGFRVFRKDPLDSSIDEVIRLGTTTNDYFAIIDSTGGLKASVDDSGQGNFSGLNVKGDPVFMGQAFSKWVSSVPGGGGAGTVIPGAQNTVGWHGGALINSVTSEIGLIEVAVTVDSSRLYMVIPSFYFAASDANTFIQVTVRDGGTGVPSINSPIVMRDYFSSGNNGGWTLPAQRVRAMTFATSGMHRLLLTAAASPGSINVLGTEGDAPTLMVIDCGPFRGNPASVNRGGGSTAIPTQQYYWEGVPAAMARYRGNGVARSDTTDIVQGYDPSGFNGDGSGWWTFNLPSITGTVDRVDWYTYTNSTYFNSGGRALWSPIHGGTGWPISGIAMAGAWDPGVTYPKPGGVTVTLPSSWNSMFTNAGSGGNRAIGVAAGPSGGTNETYYCRFDGPSARLRIWYTQ